MVDFAWVVVTFLVVSAIAFAVVVESFVAPCVTVSVTFSLTEEGSVTAVMDSSFAVTVCSGLRVASSAVKSGKSQIISFEVSGVDSVCVSVSVCVVVTFGSSFEQEANAAAAKITRAAAMSFLYISITIFSQDICFL